MFLIDNGNKIVVPLKKKSFAELHMSERNDLQEWIAKCPEVLGERLLIIQKEFAGFNDTKERLDLLALDENGNLVIIENKLDDSGRDVVWQALKYVSYCATLTKADICDIYQNYLGDGLVSKDKITEFFDSQDFESIRLNPNDGDQRIILVAANFRKEVTSTVLWLRDHGVDITCIKVNVFMDEGKLYLDTEQILPIKEIGDYQSRIVELPLVIESAELDSVSSAKAIRIADLKPGDSLSYVLDAAPQAFEGKISEIFADAATVFVNAVMGLTPVFYEGTKAMYQMIDANKKAMKLFGGGDTIQDFKEILPGVFAKAVNDPGYYFFTGGGAILDAIQQGSAFGMKPVQALMEQN